jgi:uncharacterized protein
LSDPFEQLLAVQGHDTALDQLRHRLATLPERNALEQVRARLATASSRAQASGAERDALGTRQAELEAQIEAARARRSELEKLMFGGQVVAARDLQAMDEEVKHLVRHISELEDREIEVMEALEPLDNELGSAETARVALEEEATRLRKEIAKAEEVLDADLAEESKARESAVAGVPQDLLNRYEQLRKRLGGTGAARLVGASCSGCHLTLPSMEVDRIRRAPADEVITCDQCGRILVR